MIGETIVRKERVFVIGEPENGFFVLKEPTVIGRLLGRKREVTQGDFSRMGLRRIGIEEALRLTRHSKVVG